MCKEIKVAPFDDIGNLMKNLKCYEETKQWCENYVSSTSKALLIPTILSEEEFKLAKFFITSNVGLTQLSNPCFLDILGKSIKVPSYRTFRNKILPEIMAKLHDTVEKKLNSASAICIIVYIWTVVSTTIVKLIVSCQTLLLN